ncbi:MAG TPA: hypothetical protein VJ851_07510 [Jatrophihabitans sp.]|nr:hypothetical protein [Jatrophihabitans sp.]
MNSKAISWTLSGAAALALVAACSTPASAPAHHLPSASPTTSAAATTPTPSHSATPTRKVQVVVVPSPAKTSVSQAAPVIAPTTAASPIQSTSAPVPSCYPLTNGGNCYEPGEFCRKSDHGASGIAGDGKPIVCTYNNGWRWEPV